MGTGTSRDGGKAGGTTSKHNISKLKKRRISWQLKRHTSHNITGGGAPVVDINSLSLAVAPLASSASLESPPQLRQKTELGERSRSKLLSTTDGQLLKHNSVERIKYDELKAPPTLQLPPKPPSPKFHLRSPSAAYVARKSFSPSPPNSPMELDGASVFCGYSDKVLRADHRKGQSISDSLSKGTTSLLDLQKAVETEKAKKKRFEILNKILVDRNVIIDLFDLHFDKKVGEGAYSEVWEGWWNGIHVAIKKLKLMVNDTAFEERFLREVENLRNCNHQNVVMSFGVCLKPPCIVTEFMAGGNLFSYLHEKKARPTFPLVLKMATDLAVGLAHLHSLSVLHRDLTSLNILLDDMGNVKISDFGLSRQKTQEGSMTMTFGGICNPRWRPPEITKNLGHYSEKVDVYSFSLVVWEILTGELPFDGLDGPQAAAQVAYTMLRPQIPSDCHQALAELLEKCWDDDPKARPDFKYIVARLREITWSNPMGFISKNASVALGRSGSAAPVIGATLQNSPVSDVAINRCSSNPLYFY